VVERLGAGIPAAEAALRQNEMEPLRFDDRGIRFTVFVEERSDPDHGGPAGASLAARDLRRLLDRRPSTAAQLSKQSGLSIHQVRYLLKQMAASGQVVREPRDGRSFAYRLRGAHHSTPAP
jgi:predicted HTH transcriptional regulator